MKDVDILKYIYLRFQHLQNYIYSQNFLKPNLTKMEIASHFNWNLGHLWNIITH